MKEENIIALIAQGEEKALRTLIDLYKARLFSYAYGLLQNYEDAEEAVAETFYQVWKSAKNFRGNSRVSTWLFGVCRNVIRNMQRKKMREIKTLELMEDDAVVEEFVEPVDVDLIKRALTCLSPAHREVLHLAFYEDLSYEEIASILNIPVNTVKTRVFYAKKKLFECIEELRNEEHKTSL